MEILQTIWNSLTTENEVLINIIKIFFTIIESIIATLLFTSLLKITYSKKQNILFIVIFSFFAILSNIFIPIPFNTFANITFFPILILIIYKTKILKAVLSEIITYIIFVVIGLLVQIVFPILVQIPITIIPTIPLYKIILSTVIYGISFVLYYIFIKFNVNINLIDTLKSKSNSMLISNFILGTLAIVVQSYIATIYASTIQLSVILLNIFVLVLYFGISMHSLSRTTKLEITTQNLEIEKTYNKTLTLLHDNIRGFKHDFNNIVQAIGGYVATNDMPGLKKYYSQLLEDCQKCNNLTALSPDAINNPPIYAILADKYHIADEKGIKVNLEIFLDLNTLNIKIYEFTRILGILLDNAIEAANLCDEKIINIRMQKAKNVQLLIVENTYTNKDVDVDKIFEKDFSTKKVKSGLGLWEVKQYLKKSKNLNLYTNKDNKFFKQQFEIYPN